MSSLVIWYLVFSIGSVVGRMAADASLDTFVNHRMVHRTEAWASQKGWCSSAGRRRRSSCSGPGTAATSRASLPVDRAGDRVVKQFYSYCADAYLRRSS